MSGHTTNYFDTFITVADDSSAVEGTVPPERAAPSVAERTYNLIAENPYTHTSDDVTIVGVDTAEYAALAADDSQTVVKAMRSKR